MIDGKHSNKRSVGPNYNGCLCAREKLKKLVFDEFILKLYLSIININVIYT